MKINFSLVTVFLLNSYYAVCQETNNFHFPPEFLKKFTTYKTKKWEFRPEFYGEDNKGYVHNNCDSTTFTALTCIATGLAREKCPAYLSEHPEVRGFWFRTWRRSCVAHDRNGTTIDPFGAYGSRSDNSMDLFTALALMFWHYKDLPSLESILQFGKRSGQILGSDFDIHGISKNNKFLYSYDYFHNKTNKESSKFWIKTPWQLGRTRPGMLEVDWGIDKHGRSFRGFYFLIWQKMNGTNKYIKQLASTLIGDYDPVADYDFRGEKASGFRGHILANRYLLLKLAGKINSKSQELKYLDSMRQKEPNNAVLQAVYFRITGDENARQKALKILMNKEFFPEKSPPSSWERREPYLFQRDQYAYGKESSDWKPEKNRPRIYFRGTDFLWAACILQESCFR